MPSQEAQKLPVPPDELERRKQHWIAAGNRLVRLKKELLAFQRETLVAPPEMVERLGIRVLEPLDVDDELGLGDENPRFFAPMEFRKAKKAARRARREKLWMWAKPCRASRPDASKEDRVWCIPYDEADNRARSCLKAVYNLLLLDSCWTSADPGPGDELPHLHMWPDDGVFGGYGGLEAAESARPHTMCSGSAGLGKWHEDQTTDGFYIGEIVYAATMMIRQIRLGRAVGHGILPVLVTTFVHDSHARVTQFHCDGNQLFVRKSRYLDLVSRKPTDDAYCLFSWMASTPIGDTRFPGLPTCEPPMDSSCFLRHGSRDITASHVPGVA